MILYAHLLLNTGIVIPGILILDISGIPGIVIPGIVILDISGIPGIVIPGIPSFISESDTENRLFK